jgi:hypothetical protein
LTVTRLDRHGVQTEHAVRRGHRLRSKRQKRHCKQGTDSLHQMNTSYGRKVVTNTPPGSDWFPGNCPVRRRAARSELVQRQLLTIKLRLTAQ